MLHDLPPGAMAQLDRSLDQALEHGARLRQDVPPDGMPVAEGSLIGSIGGLVSQPAGSQP